MLRVLSIAVGCFLALSSIAAAQTGAYLLRPGDTISISVWQDSNLNRELIVGPDGTIAVPLAGQLNVAGLSLQTVEAALRDRLQKNYQTDLDVTVALSAFPQREGLGRGPIFYTVGEIANPGPKPLIPPTNVLQAIAMSGGFGPFAATRRIEIFRQEYGQQVRFVFNYRDFVSGKDLSGNIDLRAGDVVVVPEKGLFGF